MAEVSGDMETPEVSNVRPSEVAVTPTPLTVSASFKEGGKGSSRRRTSAVRPSLDADEFMNLLHGSDPVKLELNRLENEVRGLWIQLRFGCFNCSGLLTESY